MQFDIIIIGGGMVGAAMACALRNTPYRIALIDNAPIQAHEDHRLIALNYSSVCLFKNIGIWAKLAPHATAIHDIHVSHRKHFGTTRLSAADLKLSALGYVVPAKYINTALYESLNSTTLIRPATLKDLSQDNETVYVSVETAQGIKNLTARWVIGADGSHSTVRNLLNIPAKTVDYHQSALVTTTQLQRPHYHIAYERFQETGAIAMLPLTHDSVATIWTDTHENIQQWMQLNEAEFIAALQKQFGYRLGRFKKISQRYTYPLQMIQAEKQVDRRVLLIGNAAHTMHPIASQGLNLALYEIATLTEYFTQHAIDSISLNQFATSQQKISLHLSHRLSSLFSEDFFIFNIARSAGMISLDLCNTLKRKFLQHAIGQAKQVPPLLMEQETHEAHCTRY